VTEKFITSKHSYFTEGVESSDILQKGYVPFVDRNTCNAIFNPVGHQIYPVQLCAGYSKISGDKKIDSCKGILKLD